MPKIREPHKVGEIHSWANTRYRILDVKTYPSGTHRYLVELVDIEGLPPDYTHCGVSPNQPSWVPWWR